MTRSAWFMGLLALSVIPAWSASPPPIGEEVVLDHGFRYEDNPYHSVRCAITAADSVVLLAYGEERQILGCRRTRSGKEIDINRVWLGPSERPAGSFDLSAFDGTAWKMAYLSDLHTQDDWRTLWLRNLDPGTLAAVGSDLQIVASDGPAIRSPTIAWNGERHLVAWIEASNRFLMVRVRPDMTVEDSSPIWLAEGVTEEAAALSAGPNGGIAAWIASGQALLVQLLDADGLPAGSPVTIDTGSVWDGHLVDACPFGSDWFVAWTAGRGISFALIDSLGSVLQPGICRVSTTSQPDQGLAVSAAGSTCILAWREQEGGGHVVRPVAGPGGWTLEPVATLTGVYYSESWFSRFDRRNLDLAWTGDGFVLLWNTWADPPTAGASTVGARSDKAVTVTAWPDSWPVYSWWLSPLGNPLSSMPILASTGSRPEDVGVQYGGAAQFLTLAFDEVNQMYVHAQVLGEGGLPAGSATRFRTPVDILDCDWFDCERSWTRGMAARSSGPDALLLYGYMYFDEGSVGTWIDNSDVIVDRIAGAGTLVSRFTVRVEHLTESGSADEPKTFDVARGTDSYLVAFDAGDYGAPAYIRAVKLNQQGAEMHRWSVATSSGVTEPSLAAIGSRYLMVWLEGSGDLALRRAIVDPADPSATIVGTPVPGVIGAQGAPYLVPGPSQVLCVFPSKPEGALDYDICAQRYDADGTLLDPMPIPICPAPGNQGYVSGVWDSNQYLLTWSNTDPGSEGIYGGRIGANGIVCDTTGFLICGGRKGSVSLASDEYGHVVAAYGGNRVRSVDDLVPLLDEDSTWPSDPPPGEGSISLRIGQIVPNPGPGRLHLDIDLPLHSNASIRVYDAAGRRVRDCTVDAARLANGWTWDGCDAIGLSAPSGVYFFRISTMGLDAIRRGVLLR
jgi:hypothetical protein